LTCAHDDDARVARRACSGFQESHVRH
jgi:hypothetical protein